MPTKNAKKTAAKKTAAAPTPWPKATLDQVAAVRLVAAGTPGKVSSVESVAAAFKGARKGDVKALLEALAGQGLFSVFDTPDGTRWRASGKA